jgi:ankyrin repeat protein
MPIGEGQHGDDEAPYPLVPTRECFERFVDLAKSDPNTAIRAIEKHAHIIRWTDEVTGETLFHFLVIERAVAVLPALKAAGADIDCIHPSTGRTALEDAVVCGDTDLVQALLTLGVTPNKNGTSGETALSLAVSMERNNMIAPLLAAGWDPKLACSDGWTPLHVAAMHENYEAYRLLVEGGADENKPNARGSSPRDYLETNMNLRGPFG